MSPEDIVLVAVLNNKRDLEIARVLGWYRIPVKTAPKSIEADWLAFYQTARFGDERWSVNYFAEIRGHELVTRAELLRTQPDHPRAHETYFKIQIGPLQRLPRPIPSLRWRRFTFLHTTGERLLAASELNDLVVQPAEREVLWKALRERGIQAEKAYSPKPGAPGTTFDLAILSDLGNLAILFESPPLEMQEPRGWKVLTLSPQQVLSDLEESLNSIEAAMRDLHSK